MPGTTLHALTHSISGDNEAHVDAGSFLWTVHRPLHPIPSPGSFAESLLKRWSLFPYFLDLGSYMQLTLPRKWGGNDNVPVLSPELKRPGVSLCCFSPAPLPWQRWASLREHPCCQPSPATPRAAMGQASPALLGCPQTWGPCLARAACFWVEEQFVTLELTDTLIFIN